VQCSVLFLRGGETPSHGVWRGKEALGKVRGINYLNYPLPFFKTGLIMTNITLQVEREEDLRLLLDLIQRLNLPVVQNAQKNIQTKPTKEQQKMID